MTPYGFAAACNTTTAMRRSVCHRSPPPLCPSASGWKSFFPIQRLHSPHPLKIGHQPVALRIDIWRDVMRDLPRGVAEAHAAVEGRRSEPAGASLAIQFRRFPKTHVMALARITPGGLFKREVFLVAVEEEIADRRAEIRPVKNRALRDVQAAADRDRIRGIPAGGGQRGGHLVLRADERKIQRIAGNARARERDMRGIVEGGGASIRAASTTSAARSTPRPAKGREKQSASPHNAR